jgi:hypothetical protein
VLVAVVLRSVGVRVLLAWVAESLSRGSQLVPALASFAALEVFVAVFACLHASDRTDGPASGFPSLMPIGQSDLGVRLWVGFVSRGCVLRAESFLGEWGADLTILRSGKIAGPHFELDEAWRWWSVLFFPPYPLPVLALHDAASSTPASIQVSDLLGPSALIVESRLAREGPARFSAPRPFQRASAVSPNVLAQQVSH